MIARPNFPPGNGVRQTLTDSNGFYRFEGLMEAVIIGASKDGFDGTGFGAFTGNRTLNLVLNRSLRITAGEPLAATIFGDSILAYEDETSGDCHDNGCLLVRVAAPGRGTLTARLTWTNAATALGLFVSMQKGTGASGASPQQVSAQVLDRGEILLIVSFENAAGPASAQLFELVTSFVDE